MPKWADRLRASVDEQLGDYGPADEVLTLIDMAGSTPHTDVSVEMTVDPRLQFVRRHGLDPTKLITGVQGNRGVLVALAGQNLHFLTTSSAGATLLFSHPRDQVTLACKGKRKFLFSFPDGRFYLGTSRRVLGLGVHAVNDPDAFIAAWGPEIGVIENPD